MNKVFKMIEIQPEKFEIFSRIVWTELQKKLRQAEGCLQQAHHLQMAGYPTLEKTGSHHRFA
jgi:cellobiose-specific phosphotransferase system component IIA